MIKHSYNIFLKLSVAWQCTMFRNLFSLCYCCKHFVNSLSLHAIIFTAITSVLTILLASDMRLSVGLESLLMSVCWSLWGTVAGVTVMSRSVHLSDQGRKLWESFPIGYLSDSIFLLEEMDSIDKEIINLKASLITKIIKMSAAWSILLGILCRRYDISISCPLSRLQIGKNLQTIISTWNDTPLEND